VNVEKSIDLAVDFLLSSIEPNTGGSSAFYSKILHPINGWHAPYPETSGYLIPTLINCANSSSKHVQLIPKAIKMAEWLLSIKQADGAFSAGAWIQKNDLTKSPFNTAQIIIGLISAYQFTGISKYLDSASSASNWIVKIFESEIFPELSARQHSFLPAYYSRIAWPLLQYTEINNDLIIASTAERLLQIILGLQMNNGEFADAGFSKYSPAYLHTISYSLEGFLESYLITNNESYLHAVLKGMKRIIFYQTNNNRLPGELTVDMKPRFHFRCLTGEAQIAFLCFQLFNITNDRKYFEFGKKILGELVLLQPEKNGFRKRGGLSGSKPFYGPYARMRQPNWATKFLLDALLMFKSIQERS